MTRSHRRHIRPALSVTSLLPLLVADFVDNTLVTPLPLGCKPLHPRPATSSFTLAPHCCWPRPTPTINRPPGQQHDSVNNTLNKTNQTVKCGSRRTLLELMSDQLNLAHTASNKKYKKLKLSSVQGKVREFSPEETRKTMEERICERDEF